VENPIEKKDSILVRKFKELYQHEAYIIQDEKIDKNLFQVIGIKEHKVREVYELIPSDRVESFIPYGIALRNPLINKKIDLNKTIVFVDDLGIERLLTVFDGFKFSRTRVMANNGEDILPEIKRSQIDFHKKTEEFLNKNATDFTVITNNQDLANEISKNDDKIQVKYFDIAYPALEGLKETDDSIIYRLPEGSIKQRKEIELKNKLRTTVLSLCLVVIGVFYSLVNWLGLGMVKHQYEKAEQVHELLEGKIEILDKEIYRGDLKAHKTLNFAYPYISMLDIIPSSYTVHSFKFYKTGRWNVEMDLFVDEDGILEEIPKVNILKNVEIKDIFVNNQPGKHLRLTI